jgi:uncharacterized protein (TIGR02302 family)
MITPDTPPGVSDRASQNGRGMLGWAGGVLFWERLWPRLWPLITVVAVFLSVVLFDLLPKLPFILHWIVLAGFAIALLIGFRHVFRGDYTISADARRARLERDSAFAHRPLGALEDRPLNGRGDELAVRLWQAHQQRIRDKLGLLRVRAPSPGMAQKDPRAVRMIVLLIGVIAIGTGWSDAGPRFDRAVKPQAGADGDIPFKLNVWITPPAYTGLAPVFLEKSGGPVAEPAKQEPNASKPIEIPVGSTILGQISNSDQTPEIVLADRKVKFEVIDKAASGGSARGGTEITAQDQQAKTLSIISGEGELASWPVRIAADLPPEVEFVDPPKRVGRANLALRFEARDDFALKDIWAEIQKPVAQAFRGDGGEIRIELPFSGMGSVLGKGRSRHDYSAHPWAGTKVQITLFAEDAKGQVGESDVFEMVLPERTFNHPVARALVEARKNLNSPDRRTVARVISRLDHINSAPAHYFHDTVVFLNIAVARARLEHNGNPDGIVSVQELLWETALRIEDGEFAVADRDLREVQERLAKAMRDGAPPEQLERLMAELQSALDKYMSALAEHLQRQGLSDMPMNPSMRMMESGDLQRMIERTRDLAKTGAMDAAREMLARLSQALDSIRDGVQRARPNSKMGAARKMMDQLRGLAKRQQQLLDQSFRELQKTRDGLDSLPLLGNGALPPFDQDMQSGPQSEGQGSPENKPGQGKPGSGPLQEMAKGQRGLRGDLGKLMLQMDQILGSIPGGMGQAERAMKGAGQALGKGDAAGAVPEQTKALDQLRQAANQAAEQLARQMQGQMGMAPGMPGQRPGQGPGQGRDPFDRPGGAQGGLRDDGQTKVPSERDVLRARKILDELHRRAGEQSRPQMEREFIDRLLRRF